jgi:hypothetical protein
VHWKKNRKKIAGPDLKNEGTGNAALHNVSIRKLPFQNGIKMKEEVKWCTI